MKAINLIQKLTEAIICNPDSNVFIETENGMHEFSIVTVDDASDVGLCIGNKDKLA